MLKQTKATLPGDVAATPPCARTVTCPPTVALIRGNAKYTVGAGAVTCKVPAAKVAEIRPPDSATIFTV